MYIYIHIYIYIYIYVQKCRYQCKMDYDNLLKNAMP